MLVLSLREQGLKYQSLRQQSLIYKRSWFVAMRYALMPALLPPLLSLTFMTWLASEAGAVVNTHSQTHTQNQIPSSTSTHDRGTGDKSSTQCFSDANSAYAYLLAQEKQQQVSQTQKIESVQVNINTATEGELTSLKGIGSHKAQAIIVYREAFGPFASVDELTRVKGIGEKTVAKNRQRLMVR